MNEQGDHSYINCNVPRLDAEKRRERVRKVILGRERSAIMKRRSAQKLRGDDEKRKINVGGKSFEIGTNRTGAPITAMALSGGGIRSASVCLGALQAVHAYFGIGGVDYLSTVSGGGFIGCSLTTGLHKRQGDFPFLDDVNRKDSDAVRHIRDFSKYLIPRGLPDLITALAIFFRGIVANIILLAPLLFLAVAVTLVSHPTVASLDKPSFFGFALSRDGQPLFGLSGFWITTILVAVDALALLFWVYAKSITTSSIWQRLAHKTRDENVDAEEKNNGSTELNGWWSILMRSMLIITAISAFFELQPFILRQMYLADARQLPSAGDYGAQALDFLTKALEWAPRLAPLAGVVAIFSKYLGDVQNIAERSATWTALAKRIATKFVWFFVGLVIPGLIWFVYLKLAYASLGTNTAGQSSLLLWLREALVELPQTVRESLPSSLVHVVGSSDLAAGAQLFAGAFFISGAMALLINPNATTFFRLYRDRLNKAFIFNPDPKDRDDAGDLRAISLKLHKIDVSNCPYPIVNAALNLEGSQFANKRGRNADFFMFTPEYVGSHATGYIGSKRLFLEEPDVDLATAMAISGAAFSPNMGRSTVKALTPTLALINARLGYWMLNPREVPKRRRGTLGYNLIWFFSDIVEGCKRSFQLLTEIFGRIDETDSNVYLTDGGNLENLGLYELLRRECDVIIAIDAEADPTMDFPSLISLTRFALTDLGVEIDLPWQEIRRAAAETDQAFKNAATNAQISVPKRNGAHCAVCDIKYPSKEPGTLFYFKSSLSGDENDLVFDYKRRHNEFPHETTMDQFFSEEQLEAYRSLGFHIVESFLSKEMPFFVRAREGETELAAKTRVLRKLVEALGGAPSTAGQ